MSKTPYLNIWNPICKQYQWVRTVYIFKNLTKNNYYYVVNNEFCNCNKYMIVSDEQVFRYAKEDKQFNNWVNKPKVFPEPELGKKNPYTNKFEGINMTEIYNYAVLNSKKYIKFAPPNLNCFNKLK